MSKAQEAIIEQVAVEIGRITNSKDVIIILNNENDVASIVAAQRNAEEQPLGQARKKMAEMIVEIAKQVLEGKGEPTGRDGQTIAE